MLAHRFFILSASLLSLFLGVGTEFTAALRLQERTEVLLGFSEAALHLRDDAALLILHEVGMLKTTRGAVGSAVEHLSPRSLEHGVLVAMDVIHSVVVFNMSSWHFVYLREKKKLAKVGWCTPTGSNISAKLINLKMPKLRSASLLNFYLLDPLILLNGRNSSVA